MTEARVYDAPNVIVLPTARRCSLAVTDVTVAEVLGIPVRLHVVK